VPKGSYRGRSPARLFALLDERKVSLAQAAEQMGLTRQALWLVKTERVGVSSQFMDRAAPLFPELAMDELFPLVNEPAERAS